ncbi:MAG: hypothetical protein G3M78_01775 [Candidatus Nitrohelix vancouverensis]|uniref:Chalcone isomerase domain-containing protein n=1 Tax=Candidatus Nitrohelix vancouverensis TaxID=2705534 RepID=A0A7T0C0B5_9BACT|nr:MAG: hypothetical protein G3M78_01775 [Candidatus Nitrohelix vancouverensis]
MISVPKGFLKNAFGFFAGCFFLVFFLLPDEGLARENPPASISIEDANWDLHSSGVRSRMFMDLYQCSIYLQHDEADLVSILELQRPVAVRIRVLIAELPDQVPDPWREAIQPEISDKLYHRFKKQFFKLGQDDLLTFTYQPGGSTVFYINGEKKFSDSGPELMRSMLEQWIGPIPISEDLKMALLLKKGD